MNKDGGRGNGAVPWVSKAVYPFIRSANVNGVPVLCWALC